MGIHHTVYSSAKTLSGLQSGPEYPRNWSLFTLEIALTETADTLQVAFSGEGMRAGTEGEQMVRDLQGSRQALDEKLATSNIQLFGRPAAAAGSRPENGHADRTQGGQPGADSDEAASEEESEGEDTSGSCKQGAFNRPF